MPGTPTHYHDEYRIVLSGTSKKWEGDEQSFFQGLFLSYIQSAIIAIITMINNHAPRTKMKVIKVDHITKQETILVEL